MFSSKFRFGFNIQWFQSKHRYDSDEWHNKTIGVEKSNVHPDFNRQTFENDIFLLLLKESVQFSGNIQPICLPDPGEDETFSWSPWNNCWPGKNRRFILVSKFFNNVRVTKAFLRIHLKNSNFKPILIIFADSRNSSIPTSLNDL
uniref:Peptidase S1 domain-containing protein n=1 Tax=Tetranychus urticae TaxID=32264 RepID=T1KLZ0_TETUR